MTAHRGQVRIQRGRGLGTLFLKLIPWVRPLLSKIGPKLLSSAKTLVKSPLAKKVLSVAKETAKTGGTEIVGEMIKGNKGGAKNSLNKHVGEARNKIGSLIQQSGRLPKVSQGPPGNRKTKKKKKKTTTKKTKTLKKMPVGNSLL